MMIYPCLFRRLFNVLSGQMDKIGRSQFAQTGQALGASVDGDADLFVLDNPVDRTLSGSV